MPDRKEQRAISNRINSLTDRLNDIYRTTYATDPNAKDAFDNISSDIYDSVSKILTTNSDLQGLPDIAKLYARIDRKQSGLSVKQVKDFNDSITDLFNDNNLMGSIMANPEINRYIKSKDLQIDMILKYMPKLADALKIKKDNVLSAENFSRTFLHIVNLTAGKENEEEDTFVMQAKQLIKRYNIEEKFEDLYDDTAKYGESFVYLVPYKKAFETLQKEKLNRGGITTNSFPAPAKLQETVILESGKIKDSADRKLYDSSSKDADAIKLNEELKDLNTTVKLSFNDSNIIYDAVKEAYNARNVLNYSTKRSVSESFLAETNVVKTHKNDKQSDAGKPIESDRISPRAARYKMDKVAPDDLEYDKMYDKANDGLIVSEPTQLIDGKINDIPGFVYRKLDRANVIPIYIEDICMGYYYMEFSYSQNEDIAKDRLLLNDTLQSVSTKDMAKDNDMVIKYIASKISKEIDTHFINANQDLKAEIYAVLKYDKMFNPTYNTNMIQVSFIPPQDICHFYFKLDPILHRGISDLEGSIMPALFWVLLTLSSTIGNVTRANDHRVWYVKQNVETNIAKTLMLVINQLKKGNMGIRQMQSMNNILGIIGKYNDYIIPVGPTGDAPVTFDTIQGQEIKVPEELLNKFEESAINSTGVPIEMVNATYQVDYATRFTMANSKFLRDILKRQGIVQPKFTSIFMKMYNYEYVEDEVSLEIRLPEPVFLNTVNGLAMLNNVRDYVNAIVEIVYPDGVEVDDATKGKFKQKYTEKLLSTYIDINLIHTIQDEITIDDFADKFKEGDNESAEDIGNDEDLEGI